MALNAILGARLIPQDELREGDKIYVVHKEPVVVLTPSDDDGDVETDGDYWDPAYYEFYLAERPSVPIPDEAGRVIELTEKDGTKHRWLSWWDFSQGKVLWVKAANGTRQGQPQMQGRADAAKSWEVVL